MNDPRDLNRFIIRMPEGLRERLKDVASANKRSMNAEIIARLESSLEPPAQESLDRLDSLLAKAVPLISQLIEARKPKP